MSDNLFTVNRDKVAVEVKLQEAQHEIAILRQVAEYTAHQWLSGAQREHLAGYSTGLRNPL